MFIQVDAYIINVNSIKYVELKSSFEAGIKSKSLIIFFNSSETSYQNNGTPKYKDVLAITGDDDCDKFLAQLVQFKKPQEEITPLEDALNKIL